MKTNRIIDVIKTDIITNSMFDSTVSFTNWATLGRSLPSVSKVYFLHSKMGKELQN